MGDTIQISHQQRPTDMTISHRIPETAARPLKRLSEPIGQESQKKSIIYQTFIEEVKNNK